MLIAGAILGGVVQLLLVVLSIPLMGFWLAALFDWCGFDGARQLVARSAVFSGISLIAYAWWLAWQWAAACC